MIEEENFNEDLDNLDGDEVVEEPAFGVDPPKVKYINNKEFLLEIHRSKLTYCWYEQEWHAHQDVIVDTLADITPELFQEAKERKAHLLTQAQKAKLRAAGAKQSEIKETLIEHTSIPDEQVVVRVMTSAHIPLDPNRKRKGKGENANHTRTPFLPFKHYVLVEGQWVEVLRSHWRGDLATGEFDMTRGHMTRRLAEMFMILVDRYSRKNNWRSYTYLDEMKSHSLMQLSQVGLLFNEAKSANPFAFFTTTVKNCFTRIFNLEKKNQNIRDDILIMHGASPSYTRQNDEDYMKGLARHNVATGNGPTYAEMLAAQKEEDKDAEDLDT